MPSNTHKGVLEIAMLDIIPEQTHEFEQSFEKAQKIISSMKGYINHELKKSIEQPNRYVLLVRWETLEDHTEGFRESDEYQEWRQLLHHFYNPFPLVEHFEPIFA